MVFIICTKLKIVQLKCIANKKTKRETRYDYNRSALSVSTAFTGNLVYKIQILIRLVFFLIVIFPFNVAFVKQRC